ncbi:MAG: hypothetical protein LGR52_10715 [Candidatus Thiosymbion ectosymbiont of Robbea hypermnestra]|nr:hypothetical protein [Candidatus Thiosymbion ectosymbiont of Robbea hypermnestra]
MTEKTETFELVFYGTSGWFDNTAGATSCAGITINDTDIVLFDLGTGTRKIETAAIHNKNLTLILSHLHLDHCYGLHILPLFRPASLTLIIHKDLKPYAETLFSYPFMKPRHELGFPVTLETVEDNLLAYPAFSIKTRALQHNTPVIGARLQINKTSITYCVDTRLCDAMLEITKDCDTLIIEASPLVGKKTNGYHLSLPELQKVLMATNAQKVIITHFGSLQYPDLESRKRLITTIKEYHHNVMPAYDGLVIRN